MLTGKELLLDEEKEAPLTTLPQKISCKFYTTLWTCVGLVVIALVIATPRDSMAWTEFSFLFSTVLVSITACITIIGRYAQREKNIFPTEAYWVIGGSFMFGFMTMGLLATDFAVTRFNRAGNDLEE